MEFALAEMLGMTVGRLRQEMSNDELLSWSVFLARRAQMQELAAKAAEQRGR